jgi:hypothetical protein
MAFANRARIDVAGTYNRFSSLERRAIDSEKCHLFTSTRGSIFNYGDSRCVVPGMFQSTDESKGRC